jgi:hypothetical protein
MKQVSNLPIVERQKRGSTVDGMAKYGVDKSELDDRLTATKYAEVAPPPQPPHGHITKRAQKQEGSKCTIEE